MNTETPLPEAPTTAPEPFTANFTNHIPEDQRRNDFVMAFMAADAATASNLLEKLVAEVQNEEAAEAATSQSTVSKKPGRALNFRRLVRLCHTYQVLLINFLAAKDDAQNKWAVDLLTTTLVSYEVALTQPCPLPAGYQSTLNIIINRLNRHFEVGSLTLTDIKIFLRGLAK